MFGAFDKSLWFKGTLASWTRENGHSHAVLAWILRLHLFLPKLFCGPRHQLQRLQRVCSSPPKKWRHGLLPPLFFLVNPDTLKASTTRKCHRLSYQHWSALEWLYYVSSLYYQPQRHFLWNTCWPTNSLTRWAWSQGIQTLYAYNPLFAHFFHSSY